VPEEVRQSADFMPIYPFERTVTPVRLPSPFIVKGKSATKGPGGIIPSSAADQDQNQTQTQTHRVVRASGEGQAQQAQQQYSRSGSHAPIQPLPVVPSAVYQGHYASSTTGAGAQQVQGQPQIPAYLQQHPYVPQPRVVPPGPDRSVTYAAGGIAAIGGPAQVEKLSPETGVYHFSFVISLISNAMCLSCGHCMHRRSHHLFLLLHG
jgi:chromatin structure-remodeling complex subunit RSC1/2